MEICPNCCNNLIDKKYNGHKRLKCMECGYETSKTELEKECESFIERVKESNGIHNTENQIENE